MALSIRPANPDELPTLQAIECASAQRFVGLMDAIADDEYVDVDGVVRPKGLGVHNSLINWTNKAVPLGQTV